MTNPASKAEYQKKVDKNRFINAYTTDFLNMPKIKETDISAYKGKVGDKIRISATDDFKVMSVKITIVNADGTAVEAGNAVQDVNNPIECIYTATKDNTVTKGDKLTVSVFDKPGHETKKEIVLA